MLWRTEFITPEHRFKQPLPSMDGRWLDGREFTVSRPCALVFGYDVASQREREVWRRLALESFPGLDRWAFGLIVREGAEPMERVLVESLPPSLMTSTAVLLDPFGEWPELLPLEPGQVFGLCLPFEGPGLLMTGVPTGEAWETFRDFARVALTS